MKSLKETNNMETYKNTFVDVVLSINKCVNNYLPDGVIKTLANHILKENYKKNEITNQLIVVNNKINGTYYFKVSISFKNKEIEINKITHFIDVDCFLDAYNEMYN